LLNHRTETTLTQDDWLCNSHKEGLLEYYSYRQKQCCDPFSRHKRKVARGLREVTYEDATNLQWGMVKVKAGMKICINCLKQSNKIREERIKLITLTPSSWPRPKVCDYFNVSDYSVRRAQDLKVKHGILPDISEQHKTKRALSNELKDKVIDFYLDCCQPWWEDLHN